MINTSPAPILALAPMAGITDWPMRLLCAEQGCNYTTTEMVSAMGYLTAPDSLYVYQYLLAVHPNEPKPAVQIFGHHPDFMARAAAKLSDLGRFSAIDINMGCPARKVTGSGSGSALMLDLPLCAQIITAVRQATSLPVTVKMRLGWDDAHLCACELAHIAQECGADMLTVHGRTREQQYAGQANWQAIAQVRQSVHIPVLLNGDITSAESALRALRETGCAGLAIGRGALGNPFLFGQTRAALDGRSFTLPTFEEVVETAVRHGEMMRGWKQEHAAVTEMRKHMCWYIHGRRGAAKLRTRITALEHLDDVYALLRAFARSEQEESPQISPNI